MKLVISTRNRHKLEEIEAIFNVPGLELLSAFDFPDVPDVEETGTTFDENAALKAMALWKATGHWVLADDTGLEVDALNGAPGVYSARFAGEPVNYAANNEKLLRALEGNSNRRARFRCVIALATEDGSLHTVEGRCEGVIASAPRGEKGFGYDPLFIPDGDSRTFAEMSAEEKNRISHRAHALNAAAKLFRQLLEARAR
ncbi:MAG TPA: XTP/dITP diphosphatase [Kiritimatiellia bacterium]|nr:XTP/dITP diphosphatase [Kiritimatiellia bacterium]